ncbi:Inositol monophosphatase 3 [Dermatophagoides pteronyssinus]|uniref:inositol-phosphate phosphatase n=1 Tax=Dermatophagoides pteronyssinus TaxID=6956 RepID=A0ABQ8JIV4_DERPT|nr:Inositol monophosphatase 3 [Dermatophagoides pteronyssinus]
MWPYMIHFRLRTLTYLFIIFFLIYYYWHYILQIDNIIGIHQLRQQYYSKNQLSLINFKHLLIACVLAAKQGGYEVRKARESTTKNDNSKLGIHLKGKTREGIDDILTNGDKRSNIVMVNSLLYTIPGIKIVSEENLPKGNDDADTDDMLIELLNVEKFLKNPEYSTIPDDIDLNIDDLTIWIDPLDATKEYSENLTKFVTTMVCVARHNEPIIGVIHFPFENDYDQSTYWATKFGIDKRLLSEKFSRFNDDGHHQDSNDNIRIIISRSHKGDVEKWIRAKQQQQKEENPTRTNLTFIEAAGSGYKTIELLKGHADIYLHKTYIKKWDICAPNVLIKYGHRHGRGHRGHRDSSGGTMTTLKGEKIDYSFQSDVFIKDGIFATINPDLVNKWRDKMFLLNQ